MSAEASPATYMSHGQAVFIDMAAPVYAKLDAGSAPPHTADDRFYEWIGSSLHGVISSAHAQQA
eukprot:4206086-Pleurochrysis_carterae.AAC.2